MTKTTILDEGSAKTTFKQGKRQFKPATYIVNTELLYSGQVFKNYKELVTTLGWKYHKSKGNAATAQQKVLDSVCNWSPDIDRETGKKLSNRIFIHEVYDEPREVVDLRKGSTNYIDFPNFKIPREQSKDIGVYKITLGNTIYIGSTRRGFRKRYLGYIHNRNQMFDVLDLLDNGGVFEIVEVMNGASNEEIFQRENEYIEQYLNDEDWVCLNRRPSYNPKRAERSPYRCIRVNKEQYEEVFDLLNDLGYDIKPFTKNESEKMEEPMNE